MSPAIRFFLLFFGTVVFLSTYFFLFLHIIFSLIHISSSVLFYLCTKVIHLFHNLSTETTQFFSQITTYTHFLFQFLLYNIVLFCTMWITYTLLFSFPPFLFFRRFRFSLKRYAPIPFITFLFVLFFFCFSPFNPGKKPIFSLLSVDYFNILYAPKYS